MRIYNRWAGNPEGDQEDPAYCIVEVMDNFTLNFHQCLRKRGYGKDSLFCGQHAKMYPNGVGAYVPKDEPAKKGD